MGQKAASDTELRFRPLSHSTYYRWRRESNPRFRSEQLCEGTLAYGTQCKHLFPAGATGARPVGAALPIAQFALPRGSTSGVEPATAPNLERRMARLRHPPGNVLSEINPQNSGQQAAGVSTAAEATEGDSNPISLINSQIFNQRSNACLRHLNQADAAGVGRGT